MNELLNALRSAASSPIEDVNELDKLRAALETVLDLELRIRDQITNVIRKLSESVPCHHICHTGQPIPDGRPCPICRKPSR